MLLAFSALPEELEVLLISVTYGNIDVQNCLRNVISLFYHIEKEMAWRKSQGLNPGFETLMKSKPAVAVGAIHPLTDQILMADYFRECYFTTNMFDPRLEFCSVPRDERSSAGRDGCCLRRRCAWQPPVLITTTY